MRPALAAVLGTMQPAAEAPVERLAPDARDGLGGEPPARSAFSSSGIRTSSTKARARACSSASCALRPSAAGIGVVVMRTSSRAWT